MGLAKTSLFTDKQNELANVLKALAHPARIKILQILIEQQNCFTGLLTEELGLAQATVSQHLKELKQAGLICGSISESKPCYCINQKQWELAGQQIQQLFNAFLENQNNCC
ncbi:MAG: ArsR/SmtB family transcription factor [Luteibaculum sp.]